MRYAITEVTFDEYFPASINGNENSLRGTSRNQQYHIKGPDRTRPADFLIGDWKIAGMALFFKSTRVYFTYRNSSKFESVDNTVVTGCSDTNTLITALRNLKNLNKNVGYSERFINVTDLFDALG